LVKVLWEAVAVVWLAAGVAMARVFVLSIPHAEHFPAVDLSLD
jgi:hypothetical protein